MIYQTIHIYIIQDNEDNALTFYGSTTVNLDNIMEHENLNNKLETKLIIERNNYKIEILESYANVDDLVVNKRINYHTKHTPSCINKLIPITTDKTEQYQNHLKKNQITWYKKNKSNSVGKKICCPQCNNHVARSYLYAHIKQHCKGQKKSLINLDIMIDL